MNQKLSYQKPDSAHNDYQYFENLTTGYWYSEVFFTALELGIFSCLAEKGLELDVISELCVCEKDVLRRLMTALKKLSLVSEKDGIWFNCQASGQYLVKNSSDYLGDFLLYRKYMQRSFLNLTEYIKSGSRSSVPEGELNSTSGDYKKRNLNYVRALDALARHKAIEIIPILECRKWHSPILDIGGGAGAVSRAICRRFSEVKADLFDLSEVIKAAQLIYPNIDDWTCIRPVEGDFREYEFHDHQQYGLIIMGNFLHTYDEKEARLLLKKAYRLLIPDGLLLIHDYFPDRHRCFSEKGALYDIAMMLNTYNGACHESRQLELWLNDNGMHDISVIDLKTDSSVLLAKNSQLVI